MVTSICPTWVDAISENVEEKRNCRVATYMLQLTSKRISFMPRYL